MSGLIARSVGFGVSLVGGVIIGVTVQNAAVVFGFVATMKSGGSAKAGAIGALALMSLSVGACLEFLPPIMDSIFPLYSEFGLLWGMPLGMAGMNQQLVNGVQGLLNPSSSSS